MDIETFDKVVGSRIMKIRQVLVEKGKEYAGDKADRLHNFNRSAAVSGQTRERALWGYATKHYVSFLDMLDDIEKGKLPTVELVDQKIGDLINYLILIEACMLETIEKSDLNKKENGEQTTLFGGRDTER